MARRCACDRRLSSRGSVRHATGQAPVRRRGTADRSAAALVGYEIVADPENFIDEDMAGPMRAGELDRAATWGARLIAGWADYGSDRTTGGDSDVVTVDKAHSSQPVTSAWEGFGR